MSTATHDAAVRFFVDLVSAEGGLSEDGDGSVTCLVPDDLGRLLDLPETVAVTADTDVSREDGALLLAPGHPVLDAAADRVLGTADVGVVHLRGPAGPPPSVAALLPRLRDAVVVDHGRLDPGPDPPATVRLPVVRAGALAVYDATPEDRFHETAEVWVDATSGLVVDPGLCRGEEEPGERARGLGTSRVLAYDLAAAVDSADGALARQAARRLAELVRQRGARAARDQELERTEAYYRAGLASIESRRASAAPERVKLLDAQANAVRAEQARRLREIDDKFEGRFELRPYRLQLVTLPAVSVTLVVRRGPRAWPLVVTWLAGPGRALPVRCPHCGGGEVLVAGKDRLGCRICLPSASLAPAAPLRPVAPAAPTPTAATPTAATPTAATPTAATPKAATPKAATPAAATPVGSPSPPASRLRPRPDRSQPPAKARAQAGAKGPGAGAARDRRAPAGKEAMGDRLARELWRTVLSGRRWPRRDIAPGSPLDALVRVYGHRAVLLTHDLPEGMPLQDLRVVTLPSARQRAEVTTGVVTALGCHLPFTLRWRREGTRALPGELLPVVAHSPALVAGRTLPPLLRTRAPEPPPDRLDPGARAVWALARPFGMEVVARCLAAWWWLERPAADAPALAPPAPEDVLDAIQDWPAANPVVDALGSPDWWARPGRPGRSGR